MVLTFGALAVLVAGCVDEGAAAFVANVATEPVVVARGATFVVEVVVGCAAVVVVADAGVVGFGA